MIKLTAEIKRILNALAFSHAGEFLSLRQKSDYLNKESGAADAIEAMTPAAVQTSSDRQQVALYMGSELPADMMHYVVQTCGRLKNGLTVLTFQSDSVARALLGPYTEELAATGISMKTVLLTGDPVSGLARYLRRHPEVAFLACKETGYLGRSFLNGTQPQDVLPVPVVLVATHEEGVQGGAATQTKQTSDAVRAA
ncbi:MAG: hypothetical protein Q8J70_11255 [Thiobacillus sp.]|nr:hypothetical protein [Thiobacillus sp.]